MKALEFLEQVAQRPIQGKNGEHLKTMSFLVQQTGLENYPIPIILITGTCGKGSTQLFLSSILEANGYKVGLIQSPHLVSFSERIQINQVPLSEDEILSKITELLPNFEASLEIYPPNYNQVFLTVGLHLFLAHHVDFVIIEAGIGGYSDPCSFFNPMLSIITNIHKDHEFLLGNTYEAIAYDKSGIIKTGKPIITGTAIPEALEVIRSEAEKKQAPLYALYHDFHLENHNDLAKFYKDDDFRLKFENEYFPDFQWENAALAIKASSLIKQYGYKIESEKTRYGIEHTRPPGRFEIISRSPFIVVDGAHNEEEIRRFCEAVRKLGCRQNYLILGFSSNKDVTGMINHLQTIGGTLLLTPHSNVRRSANKDELSAYIKKPDTLHQIFNSLEDAFEYALKNATKADGIFFTGSMFLAGDALKVIRSRDRLSTNTEQ